MPRLLWSVPIVRVEFNRPVIVGYCEVGLPTVAICYAAIVVGNGIVRHEFNDLSVVACRKLIRATVKVGVAAQKPGAGIIGIGVNGVGQAVRDLP